MRKRILLVVVVCALTLSACTGGGTTKTTGNDEITVSETYVNTGDYIANRNSGKLHSKNCGSLPAAHNRIYFSTIEEAAEAGYTNKHKECMGY